MIKLTYYLRQRPPMYQARYYSPSQPGYSEGSLENIVSWIAAAYPSADWVSATESYNQQLDQMVMSLKVGDTGPVDENTPATQVVSGELLLLGPGGGVSKTNWKDLEVQFEIV